MFVELEITDTEPGFKGDTATGATKPAVVETGATVYVPLFVEQGDKISIDTRTGELAVIVKILHVLLFNMGLRALFRRTEGFLYYAAVFNVPYSY